AYWTTWPPGEKFVTHELTTRRHHRKTPLPTIATPDAASRAMLQCPASEVRDHCSTLRHELRKQRGTGKFMVLVPLFDLKFLHELAAGTAGTSNRRHYDRAARQA
ncbi:MAG: hypothetical protein ACJ8F2_00255, partial [Xanthobacteraceae bacterium]